jgi:hypothetical protein
MTARARDEALEHLRRARWMLEEMLPALEPADHYTVQTALLQLDDAEEALVLHRLPA